MKIRMNTAKTVKRMAIRASSEPFACLPLVGRSAGYCCAQTGYREETAPRDILSLYWGISGVGRIVIDNMPHDLKPGHVGFILPGKEHRVYASECPWEFHWLTVIGDCAVAVHDRLGFPAFRKNQN